MGDSIQIQPAHLGKASIQVKADFNRNVLQILLETDKSAGISALTGLDMGEKIGLMYHIRTNGAIVTIRTEVPKEKPRIPTITDLIPGAIFHEREAADLFGVVFEGHPNPARLVLPEDWPENLYPLRKDAKLDDATIKSEISKSIQRC
jgi:membrane-bound hydrogenase subunit beta